MKRMVKRGARALFMSGSCLSLRAVTLGVTAATMLAPTTAAVAQSAVPTPEAWFGHRMGTDRQLEPYAKMVAYYQELAKTSDRIKVVEVGKSTEGKPYLVMYISSPENLARLEEYRQMNLKLADPRGVPQQELDRIVKDGKAIVVQSYDLHSTEIGSSLTSVEFTYDLVTRTDPEMMNVLNNVISIIMPSLNPDGHDMVHDWYMKYVGTPYEASMPPNLYQKYVGHDNNRDAFMLNMVESQHIAKILFRDWIPEVYEDHHQMGAYAPRISIPPYADPIRPFGDPLVWREMTWYGSHMAYNLDAANLSGGIGDAIYSGWGHFGFHWITPFHNITGMLDESASASLATPLYVHPDQLEGGQRNVPSNDPQMNMPNPWPGGWWRPRDIVDRQKVVSWSLLDQAAKNKETVLRNMYLKAQRQTQRGTEGETKAYIVDVKQHDPLTATKMINALLLQNVEIFQAPAEFVHEGHVYGAGTFVVPMNQPNMGLVRWLLGQTFFTEDPAYMRTNDGTPIRPYDMSTDAMTEFMGVESTPVGTAVSTASLQKLTATIAPRGAVEGSGPYLLDADLNDSFRAVNLLLKSGATVQRVRAASGAAKVGDFLVTGASPQAAESVAATTGVNFASAGGVSNAGALAVKAPRVAMFKRYRGGNIDEGWTRFLLESFDYGYTSLMDAEIKAGNLIKKYDVIVLPSDSISNMTGEPAPAGAGGRGGGNRENIEGVPPEFRSGFGDAGVKALEDFVKAGGKLVTFAQAGDFAIQKFKLPVRNVIAGKGPKEFWSPGSTFWMNVNNQDPLAYGMPAKALAIHTAECQAYEVQPNMHNDSVRVISSYVDKGVLQSGQLIGEDVIAGKAAMISVKHGKGDVVLIGFRPQHRSQAHGTYKMLFDALLAPAS